MQVTSKSGRVFDLPSPEEEARIRAGIAADPDTYEFTAEDMASLRPLARQPGRPKAERTKEPVSIRLSPEVVAYFKAGGPGWQKRIDAALREFVASQR